ncbi:MAG: hypothetical protein JNK82_19995 [Myxococcaceae bacterium]|nr:hypothetical protein [Myxococcaceae bacterium]
MNKLQPRRGHPTPQPQSSRTHSPPPPMAARRYVPVVMRDGFETQRGAAPKGIVGTVIDLLRPMERVDELVERVAAQPAKTPEQQLRRASQLREVLRFRAQLQTLVNDWNRLTRGE